MVGGWMCIHLLTEYALKIPLCAWPGFINIKYQYLILYDAHCRL